MQGHWENGRYILASTQKDTIIMLRTYLAKIKETAAANGEDCSYLIAEEALNRRSPYPLPTKQTLQKGNSSND